MLVWDTNNLIIEQNLMSTFLKFKCSSMIILVEKLINNMTSYCEESRGLRVKIPFNIIQFKKHLLSD